MRFIIFVLIIVVIISILKTSPAQPKPPREKMNWAEYKFMPTHPYYDYDQLEVGSKLMAEEYEDYVLHDINSPDWLGIPHFVSEYDNPFHYHVVTDGNTNRSDQRELEDLYLDRLEEFCGPSKATEEEAESLRFELKTNLIQQWLKNAKRREIDKNAVHVGNDEEGEPQLMDAQDNPIYPEGLMRYLSSNA